MFREGLWQRQRSGLPFWCKAGWRWQTSGDEYAGGTWVASCGAKKGGNPRVP
ncbi:hypothetical protein E1A91_D08G219400v1 [Gossypium mustelinum]|uniref:Uncharacterized protein n=1 Tax=Gossypium mustelinum TaxID=34275 RepID=A0A5D2TZ01_GOSMU|nr:hypothetical protein E1A91_D08G219400v1 [Gossypium mustelinum]